MSIVFDGALGGKYFGDDVNYLFTKKGEEIQRRLDLYGNKLTESSDIQYVFVFYTFSDLFRLY